ncbi:MAG TPA: protein kinase [Candidatus Coprenecus pullistercoris]|nr:protein kinase [Candidatus Coprenecus pullistercoris]
MESIVAERCEFHRGDRIDGCYTVEKALGEGTFGTVYRVSGHEGNIYALKLLKLWTVPPDVCKGLKARFTMEFETGQIDSNYLAHSYSYGEVMGNPYILMEFCPNGDLRNYAASHKVDYVRTGRQVLSGLRDLHAHGKVHRDLKPENVLLRSDYTAVLTDFGISGDQNKRMTERGWRGRPTQIFGTYPYMPPEQVNPPRGGQATVLPTTDLFSFGVMMYEMLVGVLPFGEISEATLHTYLENGKKGNWDRQALKSADRSGIWSDIIEGCLHPDFRQRTQSADDILRRLPSCGANSQPEISRSFMSIRNGMLLRVMQGEEYGKEYRLDELCVRSRVLTIGREAEGVFNDLPVKETMSSYVSRRHCTLELDYDSGQWIIRDGQWVQDSYGSEWKVSLNGTYVNSTEVDTWGIPIKPGDIISIGDVKLRVEGY